MPRTDVREELRKPQLRVERGTPDLRPSARELRTTPASERSAARASSAALRVQIEARASTRKQNLPGAARTPSRTPSRAARTPSRTPSATPSRVQPRQARVPAFTPSTGKRSVNTPLLRAHSPMVRSPYRELLSSTPHVVIDWRRSCDEVTPPAKSRPAQAPPTPGPAPELRSEPERRASGESATTQKQQLSHAPNSNDSTPDLSPVNTASWDSPGAGQAKLDLQELHKFIEQGDLDSLDARLPPLLPRLSVGDREYVEREHGRLAQRVKRAATESLHAALRCKDAARLSKALVAAERRGVPDDDLEQAKEALEKLAEREVREDVFARGVVGCAAQAFRAVEQDAVLPLQAAMRQEAWSSWRDEDDRDLLAAAKAHSAVRVLAVLLAGEGREPDLAAFRLVCKDDAPGLEECLRGVSPCVWSLWRNKGGKTLLELANERSRHAAYAWLALASGKVQSLPPEKVQPGDSVWVFSADSLQPRPARVEGDDADAPGGDAAAGTPAGQVRVAFWDEENTVTRLVDATHIRKMGS